MGTDIIEAKEHYGYGTMAGKFSLAENSGMFTVAVLSGLYLNRWGIPLKASDTILFSHAITIFGEMFL